MSGSNMQLICTCHSVCMSNCPRGHNPHQQQHLRAVRRAAAAASSHLYCWIVGNQAAIHKGAHAGLRLIWCRVDESSCRAQPCHYTHPNGQTASSSSVTSHLSISCIKGLPGGICGKASRKGWGGRGLRHGACSSVAHAFFPDGAVGVQGLAGRQGWGYPPCRLR